MGRTPPCHHRRHRRSYSRQRQRRAGGGGADGTSADDAGGGKVPAGAYVPLVRVAGAGPQGWRGEVTIMMDCNRAGRCAIEYTPSLPPPQLRQWRQRSVPPPPLPAIKGKWPSGHLAQ